MPQAVRAVAEQHRANSRASTPQLPGAASAPGTPAAAALPAGDGQRGGEGDSSAQAAAAAAPEGWEGEALDVAEPEGGAGCPAEACSLPSSAAKQPVEGAAAPVDPAPPAAAAGSSGDDPPSCEQAHGEGGPGGCPPLTHGIGGSAGHILAPAASAEREAVVAAAAPAAEPLLDAGHLSPANSRSASRATSPAGRWSGTGAASGSRRGGVDEATSPTGAAPLLAGGAAGNRDVEVLAGGAAGTVMLRHWLGCSLLLVCSRLPPPPTLPFSPCSRPWQQQLSAPGLPLRPRPRLRLWRCGRRQHASGAV